MNPKGNTDTIRRMLFLQEGTELPKDFTLHEKQWGKLIKEVPKVVKRARELNPEILDTLELREKIQKGLALRFYEIQRAAERAIQKRKLKPITMEELREVEEGAFLVTTETGSIHYFEVVERHLDYLQCENYDRQSYYNLKLSEQHSTQKHDIEEADEGISRLQKIRIKITTVGQLEILKGIKDLSGYVDYKRAFTTTKIQSIFTSPEVGATSQGYGEISEAISQLTTHFMMDLSTVQGKSEAGTSSTQQKTLTIPSEPEDMDALPSVGFPKTAKNVRLAQTPNAQTKFFAKLHQPSDPDKTVDQNNPFPVPKASLFKTKSSRKIDT